MELSDVPVAGAVRGGEGGGPEVGVGFNDVRREDDATVLNEVPEVVVPNEVPKVVATVLNDVPEVFVMMLSDVSGGVGEVTKAVLTALDGQAEIPSPSSRTLQLTVG